ncbi:MAG: PASTA domain-containing protein [bacterium]
MKRHSLLTIMTIVSIVFLLVFIQGPYTCAQFPQTNLGYPYLPGTFYNQQFQYPQIQQQTFPSYFGPFPYGNFPSYQFQQLPWFQPTYFQPRVYQQLPQYSQFPQFQPYRQYQAFPRLPFSPGYFSPFPYTPYYPYPPYTPQQPVRTVPDVVGLTEAEAAEDIVAAQLTVGTITREYDPNVPAGYVISQNPSADTQVARGSAVTLKVSRGPQMTVALEMVADGFDAPVGLVSPGDGSGRLFIVDQTGEITILMPDGSVLPEPFLDISDNMGNLNANYDERGLLGLAFHPDFATNGRFFVYYSAPLRSGAPVGWNHTSTISEFSIDSGDPNMADPDSEDIILQVDQPQSNHNAGQLVFGPEDGYLYISLGDGGGSNDTATGHNAQVGNGQDIVTLAGGLLGSILRIDVNTTTGSLEYGIPDDNPFVDKTGLDEIFAFGFRNPFRMSFDAAGDHDLFVADAGQNLWEEVSIVNKGRNYGWNIKEGTHCFNPSNPNQSPSSCPSIGPNGLQLTNPIIEYRNADGIGSAVIGGYVYRGSYLTGFNGKYVFGDWSATGDPDGTLFIATPAPEDGMLWPMGEIQVASSKDDRLNEYVLSFGQDADNELYVLTSENPGPSGNTGKVYRMLPTSGSVPFVNVYDQTIFPYDEVTVAAVGYDGPGWIVIHDSTSVVIGQAHVDAGTTTDITVDLYRDADDDEVLHAMLHTDADTIGTFEFPGADAPVVGDRGVVVVRSFTVTLCTSPIVPDVEGMTVDEAEDEITSCNLDLGAITLDYSTTIPPGRVIDQNPAAGTSVPAGTDINLLISVGSVTFSQQVQPIFTSRCVQCHNSQGSANFLPLTAGVAYDNLVDEDAEYTGSGDGILVVPGDSANSVLYQRVSGIGLPANEARMPLNLGPLTSQGLSFIRTWIDEGAYDY